MGKIKQLLNFINRHPLASKHLFLAYKRLVLWQLSQFPLPKERVLPFLGKTKLVVKKGLTGPTGNIYTGLHEFADMGFLIHFLRKEDTFADIGANVGCYTVLASGHIGAQTLAFEPVKSTFEWLMKNVQINNIYSKVICHGVALGDEKGSVSFTTGFDTINHVATANELAAMKNKVTQVQIEPFDSFLNYSDVPSLIKIDVE